MKRFVICTNDYPYVALPEGTTQEEVDDTLRRLTKAEESRKRDDRRYIHYHAHEIPVVDPKDVKLWQ